MVYLRLFSVLFVCFFSGKLLGRRLLGKRLLGRRLLGGMEAIGGCWEVPGRLLRVSWQDLGKLLGGSWEALGSLLAGNLQ